MLQECPPYSLVACPAAKKGPGYLVDNFYTLDITDVKAVQQSIMQDGPATLGYKVHRDFYDYWWGTVSWPDDVYSNGTKDALGGHAVLVVGWQTLSEPAKAGDKYVAWICKNSWGGTGGPFGDGTFMIRSDDLYKAAKEKGSIRELANFTVKEGVVETGHKVSGTVTDKNSGAPIKKAKVKLKGYGKDKTDESGKYAFTGVKDGTHKIIVNKRKYQKVKDKVTVGGANVKKDIALKKE